VCALCEHLEARRSGMRKLEPVFKQIQTLTDSEPEAEAEEEEEAAAAATVSAPKTTARSPSRLVKERQLCMWRGRRGGSD
jgi:hypothetical protein